MDLLKGGHLSRILIANIDLIYWIVGSYSRREGVGVKVVDWGLSLF